MNAFTGSQKPKIVRKAVIYVIYTSQKNVLRAAKVIKWEIRTSVRLEGVIQDQVATQIETKHSKAALQTAMSATPIHVNASNVAMDTSLMRNLCVKEKRVKRIIA